MESDRNVRRNERAVFRPLAEGEGGVLLHLDSGAYHGLNEVGTLIWDLIGEGSSIADLIDGVGSRLAETPPELASDVTAFIDDLVNRELLILEDE